MSLPLLISLLGGFGACCRYLLDRIIGSRMGKDFPYGTMAVNVLGSFGAGIVVGATAYQTLAPTVVALLLTGFLGGFTTASTISYEVVEMLGQRRLLGASVVALGTMILAIAAGFLGLALGAV
jgi:CrcB protein